MLEIIYFSGRYKVYYFAYLFFSKKKSKSWKLLILIPFFIFFQISILSIKIFLGYLNSLNKENFLNAFIAHLKHNFLTEIHLIKNTRIIYDGTIKINGNLINLLFLVKKNPTFLTMLKDSEFQKNIKMLANTDQDWTFNHKKILTILPNNRRITHQTFNCNQNSLHFVLTKDPAAQFLIIETEDKAELKCSLVNNDNIEQQFAEDEYNINLYTTCIKQSTLHNLSQKTTYNQIVNFKDSTMKIEAIDLNHIKLKNKDMLEEYNNNLIYFSIKYNINLNDLIGLLNKSLSTQISNEKLIEILENELNT